MIANKPLPAIPTETSRAARSLYNLQYIYVRVGDHLDELYSRIDMQNLGAGAGLDAETSFRLALASAFQLAEGLPDALVAEATLRRMDWKYALYLPVRHPGISETALCEFRGRLFSSPKALNEFGILLRDLNQYGLFANAAQPTLEAEMALAMICQVNRLYQLHTAMKSALVLLVSEAPDWLLEHVSPYWYQRYQSGPADRSSPMPGENLQEETIRMGKDIQHLLAAIDDTTPSCLSERMEIQRIAQL
ncbi:hypothetical protein EG834_06720, partial [bacterium]|nr:hypothetical protein [bacterium]